MRFIMAEVENPRELSINSEPMFLEEFVKSCKAYKQPENCPTLNMSEKQIMKVLSKPQYFGNKPIIRATWCEVHAPYVICDTHKAVFWLYPDRSVYFAFKDFPATLIAYFQWLQRNKYYNERFDPEYQTTDWSLGF